MRASPIKSAPRHLSRLLLVLALIFASGAEFAPPASAQIDQTINTKVWEMLYGLNPNQIQASWLTNQMPAGTNPLLPNSQLQVSTFTSTSTTVSLTFPTVATKLYTLRGGRLPEPDQLGQPSTGVSFGRRRHEQHIHGPRRSAVKSFFHVVVQRPIHGRTTGFLTGPSKLWAIRRGRAFSRRRATRRSHATRYRNHRPECRHRGGHKRLRDTTRRCRHPGQRPGYRHDYPRRVSIVQCNHHRADYGERQRRRGQQHHPKTPTTPLCPVR